MSAQPRFRSFVALSTVLVASVALVAAPQGEPALDITSYTLDSGGGASSGGAFVLAGSIGQPDAGPVAATGGSFSLIGGFHAGGGMGAPPCPADINRDGEVGFNDLVSLLSAWGMCDGLCLADLDGDGAVGFTDLVSVLSAWGPC